MCNYDRFFEETERLRDLIKEEDLPEDDGALRDGWGELEEEEEQEEEGDE